MFAKEFVVDGIRYRALPDKKAAKIARQLYQKFLPFKGDRSLLGKGAEATEAGRAAIAKHIYEPHAGREAAVDYANRLGTSNESYWSSWFFGVVYGHNPEYRALSNVGKTLYGYPHSSGMQKRNAIEASPEAYKGKKDYVMFSFEEAPVDVGDSIVSINRENPVTFDTFKRDEQQMKSHGRVIARVGKGKAMVHGGNESGNVGMAEIDLTKAYKVANLDETGRHIHPSVPDRYTGLLKRVKVLGKNTPAVIAASYARKVSIIAVVALVGVGIVRGVQEIRK